jgi:hypothetical protein
MYSNVSISGDNDMDKATKYTLQDAANKLERMRSDLASELKGNSHGVMYLASLDASLVSAKLKRILDESEDDMACDDEQQFLLNMAFKHLNDNQSDEVTSRMAYAMQAEILQLNEALDIETRRTATLDNLCRLSEAAEAAGCPRCEDAIESDGERAAMAASKRWVKATNAREF